MGSTSESFLDSFAPSSIVLATINDETTARWVTLALELANIGWFLRYIIWPTLFCVITFLRGIPSHFLTASGTDNLLSCESKSDDVTQPQECAEVIATELMKSRYEAAEKNMENTLTLMHDILEEYAKDAQESAEKEAAKKTAAQKEEAKKERVRVRAEEEKRQREEEKVQRAFEAKVRRHEVMKRTRDYFAEKREREKEAQRRAVLEARQQADEEERRRAEHEATVKAEQQAAEEMQRQVAERERVEATVKERKEFAERIRNERAKENADRKARRKAAKEASEARIAQETARKTEANKRRAAQLEEVRQRDLAEQRSQREQAERRHKLEQERAKAQRDQFNSEYEEQRKKGLTNKLPEVVKHDDQEKSERYGETRTMEEPDGHQQGEVVESQHTPTQPASQPKEQELNDHELEERMTELMRLGEEAYKLSEPINFSIVDDGQADVDPENNPSTTWETLEADRAVHAAPDELAKRRIARVRKPRIRAAHRKQQSGQVIPSATDSMTQESLSNSLQTDAMEVDQAAGESHEAFYADFTDSTSVTPSKALKQDQSVREYKKLQGGPANFAFTKIETNDDHEMTQDSPVTDRISYAVPHALPFQRPPTQTQHIALPTRTPAGFNTSQSVSATQPQNDTLMEEIGPVVAQHAVVGFGHAQQAANAQHNRIIQTNEVGMPPINNQSTIRPAQPSSLHHPRAPHMHPASVIGHPNTGWHPASGVPSFAQQSFIAPGIPQSYPQGHVPHQSPQPLLGQSQPARPVKKITKDSSPDVKRNATYEEWLAADEDTRVRINNLRKKVKRAPYE